MTAPFLIACVVGAVLSSVYALLLGMVIGYDRGVRDATHGGHW